MNKPILYFVMLSLFFYSCKEKNAIENPVESLIPVTLTTIDTTAIESYSDLNATATYLVKNIIKANATGYLNAVNVASNDYVTKGKVLFTLKTREAKVLGNTINKIDPSLHFGGAIKVIATSNGYINSINIQQGDYVQDGDQLAIISDSGSFAIVLSMPYDFKKFVRINQELMVFLPDGTTRKAYVQKFIPTVDLTSQTQSVVLKINGKQDIPENLIIKVRINKASNSNTVSLPKAAILSDETETDFWIMKMLDNNTAIKISIKKGMETQEKVEILSPVLTSKDRILLTGNYGLADTIKVKVVKN